MLVGFGSRSANACALAGSRKLDLCNVEARERFSSEIAKADGSFPSVASFVRSVEAEREEHTMSLAGLGAVC